MLLINSILKDRPRSNPVKAGIVRGVTPSATLIYYSVFIPLTIGYRGNTINLLFIYNRINPPASSNGGT